MEIPIWNSLSQSYSTVVCESTTESFWWSRFTALDTRWRNETMHDAIDKSLLTHLVNLITIMRELSNAEIEEVLDGMEDIELQYLDLLLHDLSSAIWNSNYHVEIQKSWGQLPVAFSPNQSEE